MPARSTGTSRRVSAWFGAITSPPPMPGDEQRQQRRPAGAVLGTRWTATSVPDEADDDQQQTDRDQRPAEAVDDAAAERCGHGRAEGERGDRQTGGQRGVLQPGLQDTA